MCQAKPGPRCYNDSVKSLSRLTAKLSEAHKELNTQKAVTSAAQERGDFNGYEKSRKVEQKIRARVEGIYLEKNHMQREVDGTKTGIKELTEKMVSTTDEKVLQELKNRLAAAKGFRFNREEALAAKQTGRRSLYRIAGEKAAA